MPKTVASGEDLARLGTASLGGAKANAGLHLKAGCSKALKKWRKSGMMANLMLSMETTVEKEGQEGVVRTYDTPL